MSMRHSLAVLAVAIAAVAAQPVAALAASSLPAGFVAPLNVSGFTCDGSHTCIAYDPNVDVNTTPVGLPAVSPDGSFVYTVPANGRIDWYHTSSAGYLESDTASCLGPAGCTAIRGVTVSAIAMSPDGHFVYGTGWEGIAVFSRDATTGALTQLAGTNGCVTETAVTGCGLARGVGTATAPVVSPDGSALYVVGSGADVASFAIGGSGALTQPAGTAGCVATAAAAAGDGCATALDPLFAPTDIVPVGTSVYVRSLSVNDVAAFQVLTQGPGAGELTQHAAPAGCFNGTGDGGCATVRAPSTAALTASADGSRLYLSNEGTIGFGVVDRNTGTGALSQPAGAAGCLLPSAADGCTASAASGDIGPVTPLADGSFLFATETGDWHHYTASAGGFVDAGVIACSNGCEPTGRPGARWSPTLSDVGYGRGPQSTLEVFQRETWPSCATSIGPIPHTSPTTVASICTASTGEVPALVSSTAAHGSFDGSGTYVPAAGFTGADDVTLTVEAGGVTTAFPVSIQIDNQAPVCVANSTQSLNAYGDVPVAFELGCSDDDLDPLTIHVSVLPAHGTVSLSHLTGDPSVRSGPVIYTPAADSLGTDAFSITASDFFGGVSTSIDVTVDVQLGLVVAIGPPSFQSVVPQAGTYHGMPLYIGWLQQGYRFTPTFTGHVSNEPTITATSLHGAVTHITFPPVFPPQSIERLPFSSSFATTSILRVSVAGISGTDANAYAGGTDALLMRMAMPLQLVVTALHRKSATLKAQFEGPRAQQRGTAELDRLSHNRWSRVKTLAIRGTATVTFKVKLDKKIYRVLYTPKDALDLVGSYSPFKAVVAHKLAATGGFPLAGGRLGVQVP
jgi:hypothetical protein